jgi:hypothetical protein
VPFQKAMKGFLLYWTSLSGATVTRGKKSGIRSQNRHPMAYVAITAIPCCYRSPNPFLF